jgi:hypothetical protein
VKSLNSETPIYEAGEYCECCGRTELLGEMWWDDMSEKIIVCQPCHSDMPKLKAWVMAEMERFLEESPEYERLPNGNWRKSLADVVG